MICVISVDCNHITDSFFSASFSFHGKQNINDPTGTDDSPDNCCGCPRQGIPDGHSLFIGTLGLPPGKIIEIYFFCKVLLEISSDQQFGYHISRDMKIKTAIYQS